MRKYVKNIIDKVCAKWRETLLNTGPVDVEGATRLIRKLIGKNTRVYTVDSPIQFILAQGVMRGACSKKRVEALCGKIGIDSTFIHNIEHCGPLSHNLARAAWPHAIPGGDIATYMCTIASAGPPMPQLAGTTRLGVQQQIRHNCGDIEGEARRLATSFDPSGILHDAIAYREIISATKFGRHLASGFVRNAGDYAVSLSDIFSEAALPNTVTQFGKEEIMAEIFHDIMHATDTSAVLSTKLLHYVPSYMAFTEKKRRPIAGGDGLKLKMRLRATGELCILILAERPTLKLNAQGELHCDNGPAIKYATGKPRWYIDGHELRPDLGEMIVMRPEQLTPEVIHSITNEEERRIAIERFGWPRYMLETKCIVVERRQNWIDNTVEALVEIPAPEHRKELPARVMFVACRSTGRKYTIRVPGPVEIRRSVEMDRSELNAALAPIGTARRLRENFPSSLVRQNTNITSCENAQKWMADGAYSPYLAITNCVMRVIGAS